MAVEMDTPSASATVRYLPVSPYKIRQVLDLVRGLPVDDAIRVLQLCQKDAADSVLKLLDSAVANAEHNRNLPADEMYLARIWCDEGPTRKSGQARARGRYFRVRKRTSHMTIVLARYDADVLEERRRRDEASGRGAATAQRRRSERVRRSRQREQAPEHDHDHDHEAHDHDHDHEHDEPVVDEVTSEATTEETSAVTEALAPYDTATAEAETGATEADADEAGEE
jgi:large subunit ribosomal protein L22